MTVANAGVADDHIEPQSHTGISVQEIHIDFLLWEEFSTDESFVRKFVEACSGRDEFTALEGPVAHSVMDPLGESDLLLRYRAIDGEIVGLLVEDKVGAAFQPRQATRYRERGELGVPTKWKRFITCLVAPQRLIQKDHGFGAAISLETLKDWLSERGSKRHAFKLQVLDEAIRKQATAGPQIIDPVMTEFRKRYFELLEQEVDPSLLAMNRPGPSARGEMWFRLRSGLLGGGAFILHKSERGNVDLTFPGSDAGIIRQCEGLLEYGMGVHQTGKSGVIRLGSPPITQYELIETAKLLAAFDAALRLCHFYKRERERLTPILDAAKQS